MFQEVSRLILYRDNNKSSILWSLSEIFRDFQNKNCSKEELVDRIHEQINMLLELATDYGFSKNLWQNYLTFFLITNENPFSISCEKIGAQEGSVNYFAKEDFKIFKRLFDFDFSVIEKALNINCFGIISNYQSVNKRGILYKKNISLKIQNLSEEIHNSYDENDIFHTITQFYKDYGLGMFGLNPSFRVQKNQNNLEFLAVHNMDEVVLEDLIGYELQKKEIRRNTKAFVEGRPCNNLLLHGDSGTGKSTSIKAMINEFYPQGLRMIEVYKHQFEDLSTIISKIKKRNYRFIIYMDDLSFEDFEIGYKYLKAVIEGGVESRPENVLIYATSNRRHLIRETWKDRLDMTNDEIHHSDTMEEKLSLAARFGVSIYFSKPNRKEYLNMVEHLAKQYPTITLDKDMLFQKANQFEVRNGGLTGRTAQQFIHYLLSQS